MSSITNKPCCVGCGKEIVVLKCESCVQIAASNRLSVPKGDSQHQYALIEQVDDWECNAINKIQETADEARRLILKYTTDRISQVESKLIRLTDQLRQCRQENNFASKSAVQWREELAHLSKQLVTPSNITVRESFTPLVTKIYVDIPGKNASFQRKCNFSWVPYAGLSTIHEYVIQECVFC